MLNVVKSEKGYPDTIGVSGRSSLRYIAKFHLDALSKDSYPSQITLIERRGVKSSNPWLEASKECFEEELSSRDLNIPVRVSYDEPNNGDYVIDIGNSLDELLLGN